MLGLQNLTCRLLSCVCSCFAFPFVPFCGFRSSSLSLSPIPLQSRCLFPRALSCKRDLRRWPQHDLRQRPNLPRISQLIVERWRARYSVATVPTLRFFPLFIWRAFPFSFCALLVVQVRQLRSLSPIWHTLFQQTNLPRISQLLMTEMNGIVETECGNSLVTDYTDKLW